MKANLIIRLMGLGLCLCAASVWAERIAITNAEVYTAGKAGVLSQATVVIENGKIAAINPKSINADTTIDAKGKILTPGLIAPMTELGLVEVGAVSGSRDAKDKKAKAGFDPSLAFNPRSSLIPYARKGGITSSIVVPAGGDHLFKGQAFVADLSAGFDSVRKTQLALYVRIGEKSKGSRAMDIQSLSHALADAEHKIKTAKKSSKTKPSERYKQELMKSVLAAKTPLIASVDRAADIVQLLKLKKQFSLNLVLQDAADAPVVAEQLAEAKVPVIINAMNNLPESFDSLHNAMSNAGVLAKAGVTVILQNSDSHNMYQLRFDAGNAVAQGMDKQQALQAVTANVATVFDLNTGVVAVGKIADLVLWSADPFELSSRVEQLWIAGKEYSVESRQDKLRQRYLDKGAMPKGYVK